MAVRNNMTIFYPKLIHFRVHHYQIDKKFNIIDTGMIEKEGAICHKLEKNKWFCGCFSNLKTIFNIILIAKNNMIKFLLKLTYSQSNNKKGNNIDTKA